MNHARKRFAAVLAAMLCCASVIAQPDWRQNDRHMQQQQMQIQQQQNQQGLANQQPAPRRLSREERDLLQQDRDASRIAG